MREAIPILTLDRLGYRLGQEWLFRDLCLKVGPGEIVGVRGDNGVGKTTLLDLIGGDLQSRYGIVTFRGLRLSRQPPWRRARMGMGRLYQGIESLQSLSALDLVRLSMAKAAGPRTENADEWLDRFGLVGDRATASGLLSWGSQRLLALAALFAMRPCLFVLDEPAAGLSEMAMTTVSTQLLEACRAGEAGAIVVEHRLPFLEAAGARRFVLSEQRLVEE